MDVACSWYICHCVVTSVLTSPLSCVDFQPSCLSPSIVSLHLLVTMVLVKAMSVCLLVCLCVCLSLSVSCLWSYYYYHKCHGLECCNHIVAVALYKNLDIKLLHSSMQTSADHRSRRRHVSRTTDEKGETWSPSGMSKVRSMPESLVADCSTHVLQS